MTGRPLRIGITGPIGCGKSTVAGWLGERPGVLVIDADRVARDVLAPGTVEVEAVYARFGEDLRQPDGTLDRAALGRIVFADQVALRDLEAIVHPTVRSRILAAVDAARAAGATAVVIEAIKLIEGGLADLCEEVWLVTCAPEVQRQRLTARGANPEDAQRRIEAQEEIADRARPRTTRMIDTSGKPSESRVQAESLLQAALSPRA